MTLLKEDRGNERGEGGEKEGSEGGRKRRKEGKKENRKERGQRIF